jgi:hypothetical protein
MGDLIRRQAKFGKRDELPAAAQRFDDGQHGDDGGDRQHDADGPHGDRQGGGGLVHHDLLAHQGETRPAHHAEKEHRGTDIDGHRQPPEEAVEQHQKHHDTGAFHGAETGGKAKEDHPDEKKAGRLLGPGKRTADEAADDLKKNDDENAGTGCPCGHIGDEFNDGAEHRRFRIVHDNTLPLLKPDIR